MNAKKYSLLVKLFSKVNEAKKKYCNGCSMTCEWEGRGLSFRIGNVPERDTRRIVKVKDIPCVVIDEVLQKQLIDMKLRLNPDLEMDNLNAMNLYYAEVKSQLDKNR